MPSSTRATPSQVAPAHRAALVTSTAHGGTVCLHHRHQLGLRRRGHGRSREMASRSTSTNVGAQAPHARSSPTASGSRSATSRRRLLQVQAGGVPAAPCTAARDRRRVERIDLPEQHRPHHSGQHVAGAAGGQGEFPSGIDPGLAAEGGDQGGVTLGQHHRAGGHGELQAAPMRSAATSRRRRRAASQLAGVGGEHGRNVAPGRQGQARPRRRSNVGVQDERGGGAQDQPPRRVGGLGARGQTSRAPRPRRGIGPSPPGDVAPRRRRGCPPRSRGRLQEDRWPPACRTRARLHRGDAHQARAGPVGPQGSQRWRADEGTPTTSTTPVDLLCASGLGPGACTASPASTRTGRWSPGPAGSRSPPRSPSRRAPQVQQQAGLQRPERDRGLGGRRQVVHRPVAALTPDGTSTATPACPRRRGSGAAAAGPSAVPGSRCRRWRPRPGPRVRSRRRTSSVNGLTRAPVSASRRRRFLASRRSPGAAVRCGPAAPQAVQVPRRHQPVAVVPLAGRRTTRRPYVPPRGRRRPWPRVPSSPLHQRRRGDAAGLRRCVQRRGLLRGEGWASSTLSHRARSTANAALVGQQGWDLLRPGLVRPVASRGVDHRQRTVGRADNAHVAPLRPRGCPTVPWRTPRIPTGATYRAALLPSPVAVRDLVVGEDPPNEPGLPLQDALHPRDLDHVHALLEHVHRERLARRGTGTVRSSRERPRREVGSMILVMGCSRRG